MAGHVVHERDRTLGREGLGVGADAVARRAGRCVGGDEQARGGRAMAVRLNGWQRLWLVLSILYLVPILALAVVSWPTAATTRHREEFIERLPDELQAHVEAAFDSEYLWKNSLRSDRETSIPA